MSGKISGSKLFVTVFSNTRDIRQTNGGSVTPLSVFDGYYIDIIGGQGFRHNPNSNSSNLQKFKCYHFNDSNILGFRAGGTERLRITSKVISGSVSSTGPFCRVELVGKRVRTNSATFQFKMELIMVYYDYKVLLESESRSYIQLYAPN